MTARIHCTLWRKISFCAFVYSVSKKFVYCENQFQSNLQIRYLHNSIFNSNYVINRQSVTRLMMLLTFIT